MKKKIIHIGLDVGSTTVKVVVMNNILNVIYTDYRRHFSDTKNTIYKLLKDLIEKFPNSSITIALTGSRCFINFRIFRVNIYSRSDSM